MYHAGFRPDGVFTAPLKRGSVIDPLGLPLGTSTCVSDSIGMSNVAERRSWTGPASSGSVSESGGGNSVMSTFVPIEAKGGITLHPGPGPFAAGPGPFPARIGRSSSCWCLSAADAAAHSSVTAAVAAISPALVRFDTLLILVLPVDVCSWHILRPRHCGTALAN